MNTSQFIKAVFLNFLFLGAILICSAETKSALFIGNSYTYFFDLPNQVSELALSNGDTLIYESSTPPGVSVEDHWNNQATIDLIAQGTWDYVVIQCQSQEPSFSPQVVQSETFPYVQLLDSLIQATNPCTETLFYMTWGRENGDAANCPSYPPVCTYAGMQNRLRESYLLFAETLEASVSPVGASWQYVRNNHPDIDLYDQDGSHPSAYGSYLAASTFYSSMFHKAIGTHTYVPATLDSIKAEMLNTAASMIVLDSLENWQQYGSIPRPEFNFQFAYYTNDSNPISFINNSLRANDYLWDFDDGQTSTEPEPIHKFVNGNYTICLEAFNDCGKSQKKCQELIVDVHIDGISNFDSKDLDFFIHKNQLITYQSRGSFSWKMYGLNGTLIQNGISTSSSVNLKETKDGLYLIKIEQKGKTKSKLFYIE